MSTNIKSIETTKSTRISIKADPTSNDKPFNFTGKGEVKFSAEGNLTFVGTGRFTKAEGSSTGTANNGTAVLTPAKGSTHPIARPALVFDSNGQPEMAPTGSQSQMPAAASGSKQLVNSDNDLLDSASMASDKCSMPSQNASSISTGASSTNANPNETDVDMLNWTFPEVYTPENLALVRTMRSKIDARNAQKAAAMPDFAKTERSMPDKAKALKMAEELVRGFQSAESAIGPETRASLEKYKKYQRLILRRADLILTIALEVGGPQAGRDRLAELLEYDVPLTFEEAMTIKKT